jgi:FkbM family methyltransferase
MKEIHRIISKVLEGIESPIIVEIGAHKGEDTILLASVPNSSVHAFECDPRNQITRVPSNVKVVYKAVSDKDGMMDFWLSERVGSQWTCSSSLMQPKSHLEQHPDIRFDQRVQVKSTKLTTYCKDNNIPHIDFLWMDAQGAEAIIIEASIEAIQRTSWIYTEYSNKEDFLGQKSLDEIMLILGEDWEIEKMWDWDVLLKNKRYV